MIVVCVFEQRLFLFVSISIDLYSIIVSLVLFESSSVGSRCGSYASSISRASCLVIDRIDPRLDPPTLESSSLPRVIVTFGAFTPITVIRTTATIYAVKLLNKE